MRTTDVTMQAVKSSTVRPVTIQLVTVPGGGAWLTITDNGTGRQVSYEIDADNMGELRKVAASL